PRGRHGPAVAGPPGAARRVLLPPPVPGLRPPGRGRQAGAGRGGVRRAAAAGQPAAAGVRGGAARDGRPGGGVPAGADRAGRPALHAAEVPHPPAGRRARGGDPVERGRRTPDAVVLPLPAPHLPRRAAPAVERPARRHEPGRPAPRTAVLRRPVQPDLPRLRGPAPDAHRHHRARAGARAARGHLDRGPGAVRQRLHRHLVAVAGRLHPAAHRRHARPADGELTTMTLPVPAPRAQGVTPVLPVVAVVVVLALPLGPGGGGPGPADALSALVVVYCAVRLLRGRRRPLPRTAAVVFGLPVVALALAAVTAVSPAAGLSGLGRYLQVFVLVPLAVLLLIRDRRDFRLPAWALVGLAVWQGAVGVHQYVTRTGASYQGQPVRAVGTFGAQDVMGMATVVSLGLVCALGLALGRAPLRERLVAAGFVLVLLPPLALSFSRGAWIATAVACTVQLLPAGLRRALAAGAVVAAVAVVLAGGFGVGQSMVQERVGSITRVTDTPDQSVTDRYTMWAAAAGMWREQPLTGVGLKGFPEHRDSHASLALSSGSDT